MSNLNLKWSEKIAEVLSHLGVEDVCICPGSRNTPLTLAFTSSSSFKCTSHIDERSAAFFALGVAKKKQKPAVVVSTSGTAVSNFFPAVIESSLSTSPLIVITADRPPELMDTGENQTINQKNIYGTYTRLFTDLGVPGLRELEKEIIDSFRSCIGSDTIPPGPIHINVPFDEPLVSDLDFNSESADFNSSLTQDRMSNSDSRLPDFTDSIIVCGRLELSQDNKRILDLSEHIGAPILADPTSNIRYGTVHPNIISSYNIFLASNTIKPKTIIRFGTKPTSKRLCQLINTHDNVWHISQYGRFNDNSTFHVTKSIDDFVSQVTEKVDRQDSSPLLSALTKFQTQASDALSGLSFESHQTEGVLISNTLDIAEEGSNIFIGNSMAIRDMDSMTLNINKKLNIFCNRGASGIDGLVSSAIGMCYADRDSIGVAILGDLSLYHDMNGLLAAKKHDIGIKIIVLNNNGGGIFSKLDIARLNYSKFEEFWTTPLNLELKKVAQLYELDYIKVKSERDLEGIQQISTKAQIYDVGLDIVKSSESRDSLISKLIDR